MQKNIDLANRIIALNKRGVAVEKRLEAVEKAAKGKRIPGDGDGDGIPNEGRNKKPGARSAAKPAASAGRHKAGAIEAYWSDALGGKVAYQVQRNTDPDKALKSKDPWTHIGADDRNKLESLLSSVSEFKSNGFQDANIGDEDFKDHGKGHIERAINAAYKAGGGKGNAPPELADEIAAKFTPFKNGLDPENSDSRDFSEMGRGTFRAVMAAALAHGKASKRAK